MTWEEFMMACESSRIARKEVVKKYVKEQGNRDYTYDDFSEVFRRNEHLLYLEKSRYNPNFHRKHTASDSYEGD